MLCTHSHLQGRKKPTENNKIITPDPTCHREKKKAVQLADFALTFQRYSTNFCQPEDDAKYLPTKTIMYTIKVCTIFFTIYYVIIIIGMANCEKYSPM